MCGKEMGKVYRKIRLHVSTDREKVITDTEDNERTRQYCPNHGRCTLNLLCDNEASHAALNVSERVNSLALAGGITVAIGVAVDNSLAQAGMPDSQRCSEHPFAGISYPRASRSLTMLLQTSGQDSWVRIHSCSCNGLSQGRTDKGIERGV